MTTRARRIVVVDQSDPNRGRCNPERMAEQKLTGERVFLADEDAFFVSEEDLQATRDELAELRRRMTRKSA